MKATVPRGLVLKAASQGHAMQYTPGLSIYFPQHEISRHYPHLDFAAGANWNSFWNITPPRQSDRRGDGSYGM